MNPLLLETATVALATFFATIGPLDVAAVFADCALKGLDSLLFIRGCSVAWLVRWFSVRKLRTVRAKCFCPLFLAFIN